MAYIDGYEGGYEGFLYISGVAVAVEIGFGVAPFSEPSAAEWVEVTSSCRAFSINRGRSRILDETQAGTAQVVLSNSTGNFSPWNTQGSYTGNVDVTTHIRIRASHNDVMYDLYRGYILKWPNQWPSGKDALVVLDCVDGFRQFAMFEQEWTENQEASSTRVGNILDDVGWPETRRSIDTGTHNVAALSAEFASALGELQRAALVEDGLFHIDGAGNAVFRNGGTKIEDTTIQATFSDDGADAKYSDLMVEYDDTQLWNSATVTRSGGSAQTSSDSTSITSHGQRDLHLSETLHVADGEAKALADWMVALFKDPRARVPEITVKPDRDASTLWPVVLNLELWDKVNVERTDITGDALDLDFYVEGVRHTVTMVGLRSWLSTFQLSPDLPFTDWWILGTSELGTDTRLSY